MHEIKFRDLHVSFESDLLVQNVHTKLLLSPHVYSKQTKHCLDNSYLWKKKPHTRKKKRREKAPDDNILAMLMEKKYGNAMK